MRRILIVVVGVLVWASTAAPALATHTHVMRTGNGSCVILAQNGGEKDVVLPHSGSHPLHSNVHLGQHGTRHGDIAVKGPSDGCDTEYLND